MATITRTRENLRTAVDDLLDSPEMAGAIPEHSYLDTIFEVSDKYLRRSFTSSQLAFLRDQCYSKVTGDRRQIIDGFIETYYETVKTFFQNQHPHDEDLNTFIGTEPQRAKILWGDCLGFLRRMKSESVQLMVTSPPYYNAREYSQWKNIDQYLVDMENIIKEAYRVLDNHRPFVFNVGDIFDNDRRHTKSSWGKRRIPLGAYFTMIFESVGFQFVDDFIWDKGEVQSQRHKNGANPFPLYQYPVNCYEHIFVFYKHRLDQTLYPCPVCGCLKVNGNAYSSVGVKSWECKNLECTERSLGNRGKRFSARTQLMNRLKDADNMIDGSVLNKWRRDIVQFSPVIKINAKGQNILGHTAPFPNDIPAYAIRAFSGVGETVLDPFAGSFTTPIKAIKLGRRGVGIELNKTMFRTAILRNIENQLPTLSEHRSWMEYDANFK